MYASAAPGIRHSHLKLEQMHAQKQYYNYNRFSMFTYLLNIILNTISTHTHKLSTTGRRRHRLRLLLIVVAHRTDLHPELLIGCAHVLYADIDERQPCRLVRRVADDGLRPRGRSGLHTRNENILRIAANPLNGFGAIVLTLQPSSDTS